MREKLDLPDFGGVGAISGLGDFGGDVAGLGDDD